MVAIGFSLSSSGRNEAKSESTITFPYISAMLVVVKVTVVAGSGKY